MRLLTRPRARDTHGPAGPSAIDWLLVVAALVVQQGAFVSLPLVIAGDSLRGSVVNPFNTVAIAISLLFIGVACVLRGRQIAALASQNLSSVAFLLLILMSAAWSIHPDLTVRRGTGYVLTMLVAGYLCVRFEVDDRMRALSASFAISAIASLLFVAVFPQYGVSTRELAGAWRGVFPHKNVLGSVMAVAGFVELYLLVRCNGRAGFRWALLSAYLVLVALSRSATAWLLASLYLGGAGLYLLWKRNRLGAAVATMSCILVLVAAVLVLWNDPSPAFRLLGKDMTLTGRTELWEVVLELIRERPWLGWGYHAMWVVNDPTTTFADKVTGEWGVTGSHNAFLEISLQLGLVGTSLMLVVVGVALWRALRFCGVGVLPFGWFCLIYLVGAILSAQVGETLGQNQVIDWLVLNVLSFSCGLELASLKRSRLSDVVRQWGFRRGRSAGPGRAVTPLPRLQPGQQ